ncbi:MAG: transglutaminase domain-containing protein [Akkermansiaceae bacterium]|nr:transglutaminase domain-containing protein [Verrucomicrobiales bacterium]
MKTPRFLIAAVLLFWGWQTGFLAVSLLMALVLETALWTKLRWEFSDEDFSRIWTICTLIFLGVAVYAFTDNGGPARFSHLLQNPGPASQTSAGAATSRTASTMLRWLPMVLFLFVAAQAYSSRAEIPLSTISLILRRRWKQAIKLGQPLPARRGMNVSYPYFAICLFAASVHPSDDNSYFWGFCGLTGWALWVNRSRRFGVVLWASVLAVALTGGYFGQYGIGRLQSYIQNLDSQWLERFVRRGGTDASVSKTQLGRIGQLKLSGKIVIRVEPQAGNSPPDYLREASYRVFRKTSWTDGALRENFQHVAQETNGGAYILIGKNSFTKANLTCYLNGYSRESGSPIGLLPLPTGSGRLENLPAFVVKMNNLGAVLAEGPGLVTFNTDYGPGPTMDAPFDTAETRSFTNGYAHYPTSDPTEVFKENPDLFIPPQERSAIAQVTTNWNIPPGNRPAAMRAINDYSQSNFTYSTWQRLPDFRTTNSTPLGIFLTRTHSGHCEYFASATVLLLRQLGVPTRYAVGYAVHEKSGSEYVVRLRDAHAWCLVWNEKARAWQDFDTTPPSWIEEEAKTASSFQKISDLWTWMGFHFSKFRWGQSNFRQYMIIALVPVMGLLAYQVFFRQKRKRRNQGKDHGESLVWPGLDSEFYLIEKHLAARGVIRQPDEPLFDWLRRALADPGLADAAQPLKDLLRLHYRYRFDPQGLNQPDREQLHRAVHACLETLKSSEHKSTQ